jgi:hypothetical protein
LAAERRQSTWRNEELFRLNVGGKSFCFRPETVIDHREPNSLLVKIPPSTNFIIRPASFGWTIKSVCYSRMAIWRTLANIIWKGIQKWLNMFSTISSLVKSILNG